MSPQAVCPGSVSCTVRAMTVCETKRLFSGMELLCRNPQKKIYNKLRSVCGLRSRHEAVVVASHAVWPAFVYRNILRYHPGGRKLFFAKKNTLGRSQR